MSIDVDVVPEGVAPAALTKSKRPRVFEPTVSGTRLVVAGFFFADSVLPSSGGLAERVRTMVGMPSVSWTVWPVIIGVAVLTAVLLLIVAVTDPPGWTTGKATALTTLLDSQPRAGE